MAQPPTITPSKIPKRTWLIAGGVGGLIGLVLLLRSRSQPQSNATTPGSTTTDQSSPVTDPYATAPTDVSPAPPPEYWDYLSTKATLDSPNSPTKPQAPIPAVSVTTTHDKKTGKLTKKELDVSGVKPSDSIALMRALMLSYGGAPKGKVVKSKGHPTHKTHKKHTQPKSGFHK